MGREQFGAPLLSLVKHRHQHVLGQEKEIASETNPDPVVTDGLRLAKLLELLHVPVWKELLVHFQRVVLGNTKDGRVAKEGADAGGHGCMKGGIGWQNSSVLDFRS